MKLRLIGFFFIIFIISHNIFAYDFKIEKSIEGYAQAEHNDNFDFAAGGCAVGEININSIYVLRTGAYLGEIAGGTDIKTFASFKILPFTEVPVDFYLGWNYNGVSAYELHSNSIFPMAAYNWKIVRLSLGCNYRFTSFLGEDAIFEISPLYAFCFSIIENEIIYFGFIWGNFNEFKTRFLTDHTYNVFCNVRINENWQLLNNIEVLQSGGIALTETFYGIIIKTGVRYTW